MAVTQLLAVVLFGQVQAPPTLAAYLKLHPEEGGLTVGAENARAGDAGSGLALYDRKLATVGGVKAVVPLTMVRFEENPSQPPNLYEGLPREAKVIYLATLLTPSQWRTATTTGLGEADLKGEAKAVLLSILPRKAAWYSHKIKPDYSMGEVLEWGSLDEKGSRGMRLKLENQLEIIVSFAGENSSTSITPTSERGKPGDTVLNRVNTEDDEASESYGVSMRETVPNLPKKGQLDTAALSAMVSVPAKTTVGDLLGLIGRATNREMLADLRVRDLPVAYSSGPARAGDLLDAVALAVCGTYRRIDRTYLLVSDVVGVGTRRVKQTAWKEEIDLEIERRKMTWTAAIRKAGLAAKVEMPDDPLLGATPALKAHINVWIKKPYPTDSFSTGDLSTEQRGFLERENSRLKGHSFDRDRVRARADLRYRFVLPGGQPFQIEGEVGMMSNFAPTEPPKPMGPDPAIPKAANTPGEVRPLVVRASSAGEANVAVATAKRFGFSELWIETDRPEPLIEAAKSGLPVRLFFRPWAISSPRPDADKTITGLSGSAMASRQATSLLWTHLATDIRMEVYPRMDRLLSPGDLMSPWDPAWPARRNAIATLARTAGLAGVVLSATQPHGYERTGGGANFYSRTMVEEWTFGYDERARLAFFRQVGYDPVDLTTEALRTNVDMDTPTFPRYPAQPLPQIREAYETWVRYRNGANIAALTELRRNLGDLPVLVDVRKIGTSEALREFETLAPWSAGEPLPEYENQYVPEIAGAVTMVSAPGVQKAEAMLDFGNEIKFYAARRPEKFYGARQDARACDLTQLTSRQWMDYLSRWLLPKELPAGQ